MASATLQNFEAFLAHPISVPGGYTLALYMRDGERLCHPCAVAHADRIRAEMEEGIYGDTSWQPGLIDIYWEGEPETCAQCHEDLPSEYGQA